MSSGAFDRLLILRDLLGPVYGSEDLCMLLHVLVRRERPETVIELGTGLGVTTAWIAAAMQDRGGGHLWSVDNGAHLDHHDPVLLDGVAEALGFDRGRSLADFVDGVLGANGTAHRVTLLDETVDLAATARSGPPWAFVHERPVDWVFSDIRHDPATIEQLLATFLPVAAERFSLFIDSASTHTTSFLVAERLIDQLSHGKIPYAFLEVDDDTRRSALVDAVQRRTFRVTHLVERRNHPQNSTMWITAEPVGWRPYPSTLMRGR